MQAEPNIRLTLKLSRRPFLAWVNTALATAYMPIREGKALAQVDAKFVFILRFAKLLFGKMCGLDQRSA